MADYPVSYSSQPSDFSKGPTKIGVAQQQSQWVQSGNIGGTSNVYIGNSGTSAELSLIHSYRGWSCFNIICCCFVFGVVACYFSCETDNYKGSGDIQRALKASRTTRTINIIATVLGIIININLILYYGNMY